MLDFLGNRRGARKDQLFAVACCQQIHNLLTHTGCQAIAVAERFADGGLAPEALHAARSQIERPKEQSRHFASVAAKAACGSFDRDHAAHAAIFAAHAASVHAQVRSQDGTGQAAKVSQAALARCIFGNPYRPVVFDPLWRTESVVVLASSIYADCAFNRLPVLADALEDAGCASDDILTHLRGPGPHVRGCWVVDRLLGKS